MPEYLAPGVYVEETSFRSKSIEGVGTVVAGCRDDHDARGPRPLDGSGEMYMTTQDGIVRKFVPAS